MTPAPESLASRYACAVRLLAAALVLSVCAALAMLIDLPLAKAIRLAQTDRELPSDLIRVVQLAETFAYGGTVALIIACAALLDPRGWRVLLRLALGAFGAGLAADGLKHLIARWRPAYLNFEEHTGSTFVVWLPDFSQERLAALGLKYSGELRSFPSGHAATAVGLAIALATLYPRGRWMFFTFAVLACLQRIWAQYHFLSDVLAAAVIACLVCAALELGRLRELEASTPLPASVESKHD